MSIPAPRKAVATVAVALAAGLALAGLSPVGSASAQVASPVAPLRVSANTRLGNEPSAARTADTIGWAVNPANPDNAVGMYVDTLRANCVYQATFDGGRTFAGGFLLNPTDFPQPNAVLPLTACDGAAMDTGITWGSGNTVYASWATARNQIENYSLMIARSTNGGRTFERGTLVVNGPGAASYARPEI
ncbi:MAG: hypothetical protein ACRDY5_03215, partial [Acidimicrobiales bacterium]